MSLLPANPRKCQLCPLHETAEFVCLLGTGAKTKRAMVVGEAPGHREDDSGVPFVGRSGKLLDRLLAEVGLDRKDLYITNAVHCRPPDNRTPSKKEIKACKPWLDQEIKDVKPKYVLLLGNTPLSSCLELKGIRKYRGRPIEKDGVFYLPTYHPSFALRDPRQESVLKGDLISFKSLIDFGGLPEEEELNYRVVHNLRDFEEMIEDILGSVVVAYDIETNGLSPFLKDSKMVCVSIGTGSTQWVLPLNHPEGTWNDNYAMQKRLMQRIVTAADGAKMVAHNSKFDCLWLLVIYNIVWNCHFDTMLAHYILDENTRHGLKELATVYCSAPNYDIDKDSKTGNTTLEKLARYNAHDTYYTRKLYYIFLRELKRDKSLYNVFFKLMMPAARLFVKIEKEGVFVDVERLHEVEIELNKRAQDAKKKMDKYAPKVFDKKGRPVEFNWGSPKKVGDFLFGKLKLKPLDRTAKGQPSTSESVLKRLAEVHEVPRELMKYRECKQQLSFFIEGWQPKITNQRLHPNFKLHGTVTGRLSCDDPNLQQVPRDPLIRSLLCAPPGWVFVEADLSQIELRIAAELANEKNMLYAFQTGEDVHWKTVMREIFRGGGYKDSVLATAKALGCKSKDYGQCIEFMLKAGPDACTKIEKGWKELRKKAKAINFGYLYGMWWKKFIIYARDNYGVTVTEAEAQDSREAFFELYPAFGPWHSKQRKFAKSQGYVRTLTGRKRRLPAAQGSDDDMLAKEAQRQAINSPVQSFASDLNIMAALEMDEEFDRKNFRILGTVHDAILMLIREEHLVVHVKRIKNIMSHPKLMDELGINLSVPIEAEVTIGPWGAGKSEKDYFKDKGIVVK